MSHPTSCCLLVATAVCFIAVETSAQYTYAPSSDYYRNDTAEGTVTGGAFGAITGALIGGGKGKSGEGALIGAGLGALTGNLLGRSKDASDEQRAAAGYAAVQNANAQAAAQAVTNYDLIQMTQAGLGESVIVGAIQQRGARLDLSPQGLIALKQAGVSDAVIVSAQRAATSPAVVTPAPQTVIVERPPAVYYHPPRPSLYFSIGGRPGPHPRHRRRW